MISSLTLKSAEFQYVLKWTNTVTRCCPNDIRQEFHAFATLLKEDVRLIKKTRELLLEINLGATAIGTGVNTPHGYATQVNENLKALTGLNLSGAEDYVEATSDCGVFIILSSTLNVWL